MHHVLRIHSRVSRWRPYYHRMIQVPSAPGGGARAGPGQQQVDSDSDVGSDSRVSRWRPYYHRMIQVPSAPGGGARAGPGQQQVDSDSDVGSLGVPWPPLTRRRHTAGQAAVTVTGTVA